MKNITKIIPAFIILTFIAIASMGQTSYSYTGTEYLSPLDTSSIKTMGDYENYSQALLAEYKTKSDRLFAISDSIDRANNINLKEPSLSFVQVFISIDKMLQEYKYKTHCAWVIIRAKEN